MDAHSLIGLIAALRQSPIDSIKLAGILEIGIVATFAVWYTVLCWTRRIESED